MKKYNERNIVNPDGDTITLGPGVYQVGHNIKKLDAGEVYEKFSRIKITKIADYVYAAPKHNLLERLKYLFTGKLKDIKIIKEEQLIDGI